MSNQQYPKYPPVPGAENRQPGGEGIDPLAGAVVPEDVLLPEVVPAELQAETAETLPFTPENSRQAAANLEPPPPPTVAPTSAEIHQATAAEQQTYDAPTPLKTLEQAKADAKPHARQVEPGNAGKVETYIKFLRDQINKANQELPLERNEAEHLVQEGLYQNQPPPSPENNGELLN